MKFSKLSTVLNLACVATLFLMFACGNSNPFIGKWQGETKSDNEFVNRTMNILPDKGVRVVTFSENEMIVVIGSVEHRNKVAYRKNSETSWSISIDNGKTWEQFELKDSDTLVQDTGVGFKFIMKRIK
jgi:hypothetical protein